MKFRRAARRSSRLEDVASSSHFLVMSVESHSRSVVLDYDTLHLESRRPELDLYFGGICVISVLDEFENGETVVTDEFIAEQF